MILISITDCSVSEPQNYSTVNSLSEFYRALCSGLDVQKFISMSNFNLFFCQFEFDFKTFIDKGKSEPILYEPIIENLADSIYDYMSDNLNVYFDIVKSIDEYREKIKNYKLDK